MVLVSIICNFQFCCGNSGRLLARVGSTSQHKNRLLKAMIASRLARHAVRGINVPASRSITNGVAKSIQKNLWGKSNIAYMTYIIVGSVVLEAVYGNLTTALWESSNEGVSYYY